MHRIAKIVASGSSTCQDRTAVVQSEGRTVIAVADGAGGRSGGAEAAQMAVDIARANAAQLYGPDDCTDLLSRIDHAVNADPIAGETTCVIAVATTTGIFGASAGDSGAYVFNEKSQIELTRFQGRKPFVGVGISRPTPFAINAPWHTLLVATDGLLKYTSVERIRDAALHSDLEIGLNALVQLVQYPSGNLPDDVAIVLCRLQGA